MLKRGLLLAAILALIFGVNIPTLQAKDAQKTPDYSKLSSYLVLNKNAKANIYAKAYILLDDTSAEPIISQNPNLKIQIASVTKMTTALVVVQNMKLDDVITVNKEALNVIGSVVDLRPNEKITVKNMLTAMLVNSGNDAAYAFAMAYSNSSDITPFVAKMNELAASLNLTNTNYIDPAGLSADAYSTALEQAQIARMLLRNDTLRQIVATDATTVTSADGAISHQLKNTNRLIQPDNSLYLSNAIGIKTGYTNEAGHCLVSSLKLNNHLLIGAVFNTNISSNSASAEEVHRLFDFATKNVTFANYF